MLALSEHTDADAGRSASTVRASTGVFIAGSVLLILAGSIGMVETALTLAARWQVPQSAVGFLILAPLTSIRTRSRRSA